MQRRKYQDRIEFERLVFIETWTRTVIIDNLGSHKAKAVRQFIRVADTELFSLPKYSPDLIEQLFARLKHLLRETPHFLSKLSAILGAFTLDECANYFQKNSGYA